MEIVEKDFKLTPVSEDSYFFDLELLQVIKPRGKESREEFKISGYGLFGTEQTGCSNFGI